MKNEIRFFKKLMAAAIFCSVALILLRSAPVLAAWPGVNSPSAGETWTKGITYTIQWSSIRTDENLVILLCRMEDDNDGYGEYVYCFDTIAQNVPNGDNYSDYSGSYSWTVPGNLPNRSNYVIGVRQMYVLYGGYSDEFTISASVPDASWFEGSWGDCSEMCGGGTSTRDVYCEDLSGNAIPDNYCSGTKPSSSTSCNIDPCPENSDASFLPSLFLLLLSD
jgi:hypothetical protein